MNSHKRLTILKQKSTADQNTVSSSASKNIFKSKSPISKQNTVFSSASKTFSITKVIPIKSRKRFTKYVAFGDSYSDNGNSYNLANKTWPLPVNYKGRFTNGKVWTEYLAELLNIKLTNYAFGGATSNCDFIQGLTGPQAEFKVPGIRQQIEMFVSANAKSAKKQKDFSKTLFSVWGASNDYIFSDMSASPLEVVKSLMDTLRFLINSLPTIKTILIPDIPDLSRSPAYKTSDTEEKKRISKIFEMHNKFLLEDLVKFNRETGVKIIYLKFDKFFKELQTEDAMFCYGIINGKDAANDFYKGSNSNTNNEIDDYKKDYYFYWDDYHVTTIVHEALANLSLEILEYLHSPISMHKKDSFVAKTLCISLGNYAQ